MKRPKHLAVILLSTILLGFLVLAILYLNSYSIALNSAGFYDNNPVIVNSGFDNNGDEYRVVAQYNHEGAKLAYLTKNDLGFWKVALTDTPHPDTGLASLYWHQVSSIRRFSTSDSSVIEQEDHKLFLGNNAIARIEIPQKLLPENVTVGIYQAGSLYMLHFVAYTTGDLPQIDCYKLLKSLGCVA